MEKPEKREFTRIKRRFTANIAVQTDKNAWEWGRINIENLGAGGMLFRHEKKLDIGDKIKIKINFPPSESDVFAAGKVSRVEKTADIPPFKIAVEFIDIKELHKSLIERSAKEFFAKNS